MHQIFLTSPVVAGSDAGDLVYFVNPTGETIVVDAVILVPAVSVAANSESNYIVTTVAGPGGTIASHSTKQTGGTALTAGTAKALTVSGTGTEIEVAANGMISVTVADNGTCPAYEHHIALRCHKQR